MKYVGLVLNWAFGILFLSAGVYLFSEFPVGGLSLILISLLLLPPVRSLVYSLSNRGLSLKARGLAILILLFAFGASVAESLVRNARELAAMGAQDRIQKEYAQSQKRHGRLFGVEAWNHGDYVADSGLGLCVICHSVEVGGPHQFGPGCLSCHRDIPAFSDSVVAVQVEQGREPDAEMHQRAEEEYARIQKRHIDFFDLDTWNHADYVQENGEVLCVICHSLNAGGPNMSGRGPRCLSCHRDIQEFADGIQHSWQAATESE